MKIELITLNGICIADILSDRIEVSSVQDALDIMANCDYQGARKIKLNEKNIIPAFFGLKTGIAGEILQKYSTYNMQLAIVGEYSKFSSKSLRDFIYESNKTGRIYFVNSIEEAREKLSKK